MQSSYPESFEREMSCTEAEWLRWLPDAIGAHEWTRTAQGAIVALGAGSLALAWQVAQPRRIALVKLPSLNVTFRFEGVGAQARFAFMKRFDLYMQRGGG